MSSRSIFTAFFIALLLITGTSCKASDLRDVPVSEITLAESQVALPKLLKRLEKLRGDPSKPRLELAETLAELAMIPCELEPQAGSIFDAKQAARLLDSGDKNTRAYFLTRRALGFAMNQDGQHGSRIIKPLLKGKWSDLDKAQIYDDLASSPYLAEGFRDTRDYAVQGLKLRVKAAGPHSLEVAESLITLVSSFGCPAPIDKELCTQLQLPKTIAGTAEELESFKKGLFPPRSASSIAAENNRKEICLRRAAQIREDILGSASIRLAECLMLLGEAEKLRAIAIYEKHFGSQNHRVLSAYSSLAFTTKDPSRKQEYAKRASVGRALLQAGDDPVKKAYVYLKGALPGNQHLDQQDPLTSAYKSLGGNPPKIQDPEMRSDAIGWRLDLKELSIPELDWLTATAWTSLDSDLGRDQLFVEGLKGGSSVFRIYLPTWGGDEVGTEVKVIGKGRIRFSQRGIGEQGFQQVDYKWNGKTFEAICGNQLRKMRKGSTQQLMMQYAVSGLLELEVTIPLIMP